jgi:hypothetical protein
MSNDIPQLGQSLQQPTKWQISFPRVSNTIFYIQSVSVPGFSITEAKQQTPVQDLWVPGTKTNWDPLTFSFLIDEKFSAWFDIYQWMTGLGAAETTDQYKNLAINSIRKGVPTYGVRPPYSDAILNLFTAKNNVGLQFSFIDCYPFTLSAIRMSYTESADVILTGDVSFRYSYYTFQATS